RARVRNCFDADWTPLAERDLRVSVCAAPAARGVGGLDFGAERPSERNLLLSDGTAVCLVCARSLSGSVHPDDGLLRGGVECESDARDTPMRALIAGLLAAWPLPRVRRQRQAGMDEVSSR